VVRAFWGKRPSNFNTRMCNICEEFAREYLGGAEIELSLLFGDVRGSTTLAEGMSPTEFGRLIDRFYKVSSKIMVDTDALIDKIIGDQVSGMYIPGFAGRQHALGAVAAAQHLLKDTGHYGSGEPWIPVGIGVHTGVSFVGSVGSRDGTIDITVLGDVPNTAARLSSTARAGEILISERAFRAAGFQVGSLEKRVVELKGKREGVTVYSLTDNSLPPVSDKGRRIE
jgi:adenylate cyclase